MAAGTQIAWRNSVSPMLKSISACTLLIAVMLLAQALLDEVEKAAMQTFDESHGCQISFLSLFRRVVSFGDFRHGVCHPDSWPDAAALVKSKKQGRPSGRRGGEVPPG